MKVGANYLGEGRCEFVVWAPLCKEVAVQIKSSEPRTFPMQKDEMGYWRATVTDVEPNTRYFYLLDNNLTRPDPASHSQPEDVHGPSQVIDHNSFVWEDSGWQNIPLSDLIIYELHVGTFTPEGTFDAIIPRIGELLEMGINALEIMPVAQFPGSRNWGYDGVYPFGVQTSYGGPEGLKRLVNACHQQGMAVILDVVYNHFGPEGNYTQDFGPYFTDKYRTPWGRGINYDDAYSDGVRNFVIENALYWLRDYHIDGLRLDAVHAIYDFGAKHILEEMGDHVGAFSQQQGRKYYLIAESDLNDVRIIKSKEMGGYNLDAQWNDDFHHALHTVLTGERQGYYEDFGDFKFLEKAFCENFVYAWTYSPSRKRFHGNFAGDLNPSQFVVCSQNHDQIGNRMLGERLSHMVSWEAVKLAAGAVLLSPYVPLLFMGEEYGEEAPFMYFISHSDKDLIEAVRKGRKEEFEAFHADGDPPDAQSPETFKKCILNWDLRKEGKYKALLDLYRQLIHFRRTIPALKMINRHDQEVQSLEAEKILSFRRWSQASEVFCMMNFSKETVTFSPHLPNGTWQKRINSAESQWMGPGSTLPDSLTQSQELTLAPESFALYERQGNP